MSIASPKVLRLEPTSPEPTSPDPTSCLDPASAADTAGCQDLRTFSHLIEAIVDLPTSDDADAVYRRIAAGLARYVRWDTFSVFFLDDATGHLSFRFGEGHPDPSVESWVFGRGQGLVGRALDGGPLVAAGEVGLLPSHGSELAIALEGRDRVLGVLALGRFDAEDTFNARELMLVEMVARHLGRAIESSCAHSTTRRLARNLSLLQEVGRELTSILDRGELLERIADRLERLIDFELFCVLLWNEERQVLSEAFIRRSSESATESAPLELRLGEGLCGSAAALRQSIRVGNVLLDSRFLACGDDEVRSALAMPLIYEDRLLGVLDIESHHYEAFSPEVEQMLLTLGSSIAAALANASLYEKLRRDERLMAKDLETARGVQRLLLPRSSPWVGDLQIGAVNAASKHLGGDLYDFFPYGEGRFALALGDVAGKGTAAALYAALVLGTLRGYVQQTRCSPACVMSHLHAELRQLEVERRFLAFAFAVYESETRTLTLSNAGLPYPMLLRGGEVREIEVSGLPLGAMAQEGPRRAEVAIQLEPGDVLLLASDGLEECRDLEGRPFGTERVARVLASASESSAEQIAQALLDATDVFAGTGRTADDRTVVALKVAD